MRPPLLTNEERLRRQRARWAKQSAERRKERAEAAKLIPKLTSGVKTERRERLITPHMMAIGEAYFWGKRGIDFKPRFNQPTSDVRTLTL